MFRAPWNIKDRFDRYMTYSCVALIPLCLGFMIGLVPRLPYLLTFAAWFPLMVTCSIRNLVISQRNVRETRALMTYHAQLERVLDGDVELDVLSPEHQERIAMAKAQLRLREQP